jgi:hypothetical protein
MKRGLLSRQTGCQTASFLPYRLEVKGHVEFTVQGRGQEVMVRGFSLED